jgi:xanthine dehydrogenase accessory factor
MKKTTKLSELVIGIKGAGEMASAVAWRLYMANFHKIFMLEVPNPLAVRREVSFCEAIHDETKTIEGVEAVKANKIEEIRIIWDAGNIAVIADPDWKALNELKPDVVIDAILAKQNLGTSRKEAPLVIGLGPGFAAGEDVHSVIETNRGHHLGRIITSGPAEPNTGIPGNIGGFAGERVLRAPTDGVFLPQKAIGDPVKKNDTIGFVDGVAVQPQIDGVLRGLIRPDSRVSKGLKIGDIDPRGDAGYCYTISEKARAIGGSVLEAIMRVYNLTIK